MASLKLLLVLRYVSIFCSLVATCCATAFAAKALKKVKEDKAEAAQLGVTISVKDMTGATIAILVTAAFGVFVSLVSEVFLAIERRRGIKKSTRILNEFLLALCAVALLAADIAGTIVSRRRAQFSLPWNLVEPILKSKGKSPWYRDSWSWKAVICGWIAFVFLILNFLLVVATGIHHRRKAAKERSFAPNMTHDKHVSEHHNKFDNEYRA